MNPERPFPSDDAIERGLARRAPHGADLDLLEAVIADVRGTRQAPGWWPPTDMVAPGTRRRVIWVAIAAALAVAAAATVLGGGAPRPPFSVIVPQVSGSPAESSSPDASAVLPSPSASPASPGPTACTSDAIEATTVAAGTRTAPDLSFPGLGAGRIAFLTSDASASERAIQLWVASGDPAIATLVAEFKGMDIAGGSLAAWPRRGSDLLVTIAHRGTEIRFSPQCTDLYVVAEDGSQIRRVERPVLTGVAVSGASLSPDGSIAAFLDASEAGTSFQVERSSSFGNGLVCAETYVVGTPVWSPDGSRVAVACGGRIQILDLASDAFSAFDLQGGDPVALSWTADGDHLLAASFYQALDRAEPAVGHRSLAVDSLDTATGNWTAVSRTVDQAVELSTTALTDRGQGFAPDGRRLVLGTVVIDLSTSTVETVLPYDTLGWSLDGSAVALLFGNPAPFGDNVQVQRQALSGGTPSVVAILPYSAGSVMTSGSEMASLVLELP